MALRSTYTQRNLLPVQALRVELSQNHNVEAGVEYRPISRHVTKTYAYIGMTEKAARECLKAKLAQYTRRVQNSMEAGGYVPTAPLECLAEVTMSAAAGDNYQVDITVDYTDRFDPPWPNALPGGSNEPPISESLAALGRAVCLDEPVNRMRGVYVEAAEFLPYLDLETRMMYDRVMLSGFRQTVYEEGEGGEWQRLVEITDDPFFGQWRQLGDFQGLSEDGRMSFASPVGTDVPSSFDRLPGRYLYMRVKIARGDEAYYSNVIAEEYFPFYFAAQGGE